MTTVSDFDEYVDILAPAGSPAPRTSASRGLPAFLARPVALIRAIPDGGIYAGILLILVGFILLAVCWGKVAGLTSVGLQMPYLASAGLTGLGLIVTGIALVSSFSREKDAALRRAQMSELASTLRELRGLINDPATFAAAASSPVAVAPLVEQSAAELTTELAALLDEPLTTELPLVPVKVTGRASKATPRVAKTSARTASPRASKTSPRAATPPVKRAGR